MSAKADTWMPLYIADYRKDTARLTCEQHGAYLQLIMDYWVTGPLPDDDVALSQIVGLEIRLWKKHRLAISRFFKVARGEWRHKRIDQEREKADRMAEARRQNGSKGGRPKKLTETETEPRNNLEVNLGDNLGPKLRETPARVALPSPSQEEDYPETPVKAEKAVNGARAVRGARLSPDWKPSPVDREYADALGFSAGEVDKIAADFVDYWIAKAGQLGVKLDWPATWRRWVRTESERKPPRQGRFSPAALSNIQ